MVNMKKKRAYIVVRKGDKTHAQETALRVINHLLKVVNIESERTQEGICGWSTACAQLGVVVEQLRRDDEFSPYMDFLLKV